MCKPLCTKLNCSWRGRWVIHQCRRLQDCFCCILGPDDTPPSPIPQSPCSHPPLLISMCVCACVCTCMFVCVKCMLWNAVCTSIMCTSAYGLILLITQDCWIRNTVGVRGVFEESLVWSMILQPILHRKPVRTDFLLCDGKFHLKHASATEKKWHEQE